MASYRSDRDRDGGGSGSGGHEMEMVERVVRDVGDVVEGRKSWKDLLAGFVEQAASGSRGAIENGSGSGSASPERRRRRRRD
jgi:hypothetical protein